ncbi:rifamycin-inactivating phosphotransferase [Streptomyces sp. NPDC057939]|uniref:rifamycin-inactivating phosphotransferase n=1 Tax=Streptomyces sp. NPDC057939 TaxID=3346284 RepID=UPI0036E7483A
MSEQYVWDLGEVDETRVAVVGGKGAHLGALSRIEGVHVPDGFCVTTHAFRRVMAQEPSIEDRLDRLSRLNPDDRDDREGIRTLGAEIRRTIEDITIPADVAARITGALARFGEEAAYAVRSSATAEDLPTASFAGQQDTYLNVVGPTEILRHVSRCWASLFTERAVTYRRRNGIDDRTVDMAVVVQRMVLPHAAGVLFTADPVTGDRKVATVDAGFGLGEALVSGLVNPDVFKVRGGEVVDRSIAAKQRAVHALPGGGTREVAIDPRRQEEPTLTDDQVLRLVRIGRRIEAHFGRPQDIEWCLVDAPGDDDFRIVQSRPITTLFPVPGTTADGRRHDDENRVYVSVGHGQMMTDPMKPLGLSMWQLTAMVPMHEAGGRLFVDVTRGLSSPTSRAGLLDAMGKGDPLIRDALETVLDRDGFIPSLPDASPGGPPAGPAPAPIETDPAIVTGLIERSRLSVAALERDIRTKTGPVLFDFLIEAFEEHRRVLGDPLNIQAIMAGMDATWWLNDKLREWLGEKNAADTLTLSAPDNITSEMGLALLDVADAIRPHPAVVTFLEGVEDEEFLDELAKLAGGAEARDAIEAYLDRYGMRCVGEIDITRPRWRERPSTIVPVILDNVRNFEPGAAGRRFEQGRRKALRKEQDVLARLRTLPDGDGKADETKRMIDRVRTFIGYREYPKYGIVSRYFLYKQALLGEAERLVRADVLHEPQDAFWLTFQELHDVARSHRVDELLIQRRKEEFRSYHALTPPRVLTSDGEALSGAYRRDDAPAGALIGVPVSAGTVEGRARVVLDMAEADLEAGDILVTTFTDPSWSPLFVGIAGLVTEVGGLMTHGAVIAREYGLPAVVGVEGATRLIRDGQRIRVHGTDGYVEILP